MSDTELIRFITESNGIEGIWREPTTEEIEATKAFLAKPRIEVSDLEALVSVYAPGNRLRDQTGMDVRVGDYVPPRGGPEIRKNLEVILKQINGDSDDSYYVSAWQAHIDYEVLHPFTDGNGRSGRALWLWLMKGQAPLGFLHTFYYQTLEHAGR